MVLLLRCSGRVLPGSFHTWLDCIHVLTGYYDCLQWVVLTSALETHLTRLPGDDKSFAGSTVCYQHLFTPTHKVKAVHGWTSNISKYVQHAWYEVIEFSDSDCVDKLGCC